MMRVPEAGRLFLPVTFPLQLTLERVFFLFGRLA
jgi:hypothetical protein